VLGLPAPPCRRPHFATSSAADFRALIQDRTPENGLQKMQKKRLHRRLVGGRWTILRSVGRGPVSVRPATPSISW
jgi:hypothetical protein